MIRLIFSDLLGHARVWVGALAVVSAVGFIAAIAAGLIETGLSHDGDMQEMLVSMGGGALTFAAIAALVVLASTANLTVALQQRSYALWQLVGIRPRLVTAVVLTQLVIVGVCGGLIGSGIAFVALAPVVSLVLADWNFLAGLAPILTLRGIAIVVAALAVVVVMGGWRGALRAGRTAPIAAIREPEPATLQMGWLRILLLLATAGGTVAVAVQLTGGTLQRIMELGLFLTPLIIAAMAAAGPLLFPLIMRAWTAVLPSRASVSWYLARNSARHRLNLSTSAISPLMVGIGLTGGLYTSVGTLSAAVMERGMQDITLTMNGVVLVLGGPLLISAVGAASTVFMSGQSREREFALIRAAGSTTSVIALAAVWEAVIYAGTATLLGVVATVTGGMMMGAALGLAYPAIHVGSMAIIGAGGFGLLLTATLLPTLAAMKREIPRTLATE